MLWLSLSVSTSQERQVLFGTLWLSLSVSTSQERQVLFGTLWLSLSVSYITRQVLFGMLWLSLLVHHKKDRCYLPCCGYLCLSVHHKKDRCCLAYCGYICLLVHHKKDRCDLACCGNHLYYLCVYITRKTGAIWHTFGRWREGMGAASGTRVWPCHLWIKSSQIT